MTSPGLPFLADFSERLRFDGFLAYLIAEDLRKGDLTSTAILPPDHLSEARLVARSEGIVCGMAPARYLWQRYSGVQFAIRLEDGRAFQAGQTLAVLRGPTREILSFERIFLNLVQHLSAIATQAHRLRQIVAPYHTTLLDTRKTTPGLRWLEKWATGVGGATPHRRDLADEIMIKDNHIDAIGSLAAAIERVLAYLETHRLEKNIVLEVRSEKDIEKAAPFFSSLHRILLDNFSPAAVKAAVQRFGHEVAFEASGGIDEHNLEDYARTGVPYISTSAIHRPRHRIDLSLQVNPQ